MVKLLDIAPQGTVKATVPVQGNDVEIVKLSAKRITALLGRFPDIAAVLDGQTVSTAKLVTVGAEAVAAIIASGCGYPDDEQAEAAASELSIEDQLALVEGIAIASLPKVVRPLIAKFRGLADKFMAELESPTTGVLEPSGSPAVSAS